MRDMLKRFARCENGATGTEYALLAAMLALIAVGAVSAVFSETEASFYNVSNAINTGNSTYP